MVVHFIYKLWMYIMDVPIGVHHGHTLCTYIIEVNYGCTFLDILNGHI